MVIPKENPLIERVFEATDEVSQWNEGATVIIVCQVEQNSYMSGTPDYRVVRLLPVNYQKHPFKEKTP